MASNGMIWEKEGSLALFKVRLLNSTEEGWKTSVRIADSWAEI
jgi:hypothetical protein